MNARGLRRYVDDLLRGRRPKPFAPDDFEAAQIRTAIELRAARPGGDAPSEEFLADLHRRLAEQMSGTPSPSSPKQNTTRRQVIVGTSAAAAAAVAAVSVDRLVTDEQPTESPSAGGQLTPNDGRWVRVAASSDVPDALMHPFDLGTVSGFVRRVGGKVEAVSGVCTHQGCRLWFDAPQDRLRCPCHTTSFAPGGQVLSHQLPIAPKPLPTLMVRETNGIIEVFAPAEPA
ncbi:(2Fe-2S)-binding protein [Mycobacterium sp. 852002-51163_SCH5372311]|uniref:Rieske (2Fe-2S) protein n=1 Tax=Mycobacterium sp. 852002-51163_SCH5372311 TaxID=1834097 RepID=UPI0007FE84D9|nr:Rieske (2Fe-2S) protein [Mycobacterium sp. 852002-51163_SCH5372311]OBF86010.1 (2Fe-2S)-binding protein [Mycobacterium sp. 852002-51163_SCH5372311]